MANIGEPQRTWEIVPDVEPIGVPLPDFEEEPLSEPAPTRRREEEVPA